MVPLVGKQDDNTQFREAALEAATDLQTELTNNITEINAMNKALPIKPEVFHMRPDIHQDLEEILVDRRANRKLI
ncbi:hypothetical protein JAAARDRAFT_505318 [Jaapia argillacea MUCL 33604]|uniref:Uncharacterized protein n=1 Tax=Jaapia argillacea MUCL 33604 TaxID=933084 RepID=A0A067PKN3_9AGAM|nr:hypothetical protein JAAARDRAFT_505318 [Jaapia argillacea MUCL 33604]